MKKRRTGKDDNGETLEKSMVRYADGQDRFDLVVERKSAKAEPEPEDEEKSLTIHIDGPFGAPASNIFRYN